MTLEEAIRSALAYENKVRDTYRAAAGKTKNPEASRFFQVMTTEEQGHVDYLEDRLARWLKDGVLAAGEVKSVLPDRKWIAKGLESLKGEATSGEFSDALEYLYEVLRMEEEVSAHYRKLVAGVDHPGASEMFRRFLEIEDGHTAIVQAEIDYVSNTGLFYGVQEFTLDG